MLGAGLACGQRWPGSRFSEDDFRNDAADWCHGLGLKIEDGCKACFGMEGFDREIRVFNWNISTADSWSAKGHSFLARE